MRHGSHGVGAEVTFLMTAQDGRQHPPHQGFRGQFHYEGEYDAPYECELVFPGFDERPVPLRTQVSALVLFPVDLWKREHAQRIAVGTCFQ